MTDDLERPAPAEADNDVAAEAETTADADEGAAVVDDGATEANAENGPATVATPVDPGDASLLALIDRLGAILERSDLVELEVESGGTALVLRKPAALAQAVSPSTTGGDGAVAGSSAPVPASSPGAAAGGQALGEPAASEPPSRPSVKAPLTGIWYASPAPGSAPFVEVGRELAVGQVVGLIEAMKLFNEIKSDIAGRVVRVVPETGALVKAKQPLIEVEPL
ncbi:MAG TPA: biotin/lipoyl-containing protein [Candidatus Limnocylindrales bacterium]|jgi:acetyl-CoA carboxylase biotin carboxyl carrier protein|nr:biotin/lipoyl-containing protein [Candidatus Limnocylindrales bacterium]